MITKCKVNYMKKAIKELYRINKNIGRNNPYYKENLEQIERHKQEILEYRHNNTNEWVN